MRLSLIVLLSLVAFAPMRSWADDTSEAKRLYASGTKHFNLAEYEAALADFKEGYRHKDDPVFLYNIAQCYRLLKGHEEDAIKFYRNYLRRRPHAENRAEVERKVETLQEALAVQEKARSQPPSSTLGPGEDREAKVTSPAPPPAQVVVAPAPAVTAAPTVVATERPPTPVYKKWWLWTSVGVVVAVGVGVGLGVGLSQSNSPNFPKVVF